MAGQEKYLSFSWKDDQSDSFTVDVDLGGAQKFTNFKTEQANGAGSIFFEFCPNVSRANTTYNI